MATLCSVLMEVNDVEVVIPDCDNIPVVHTRRFCASEDSVCVMCHLSSLPSDITKKSGSFSESGISMECTVQVPSLLCAIPSSLLFES